MNAYFISGLGADWRAFQRIELPPGYNIIHVAWLPTVATETLLQYAERLLHTMDTSGEFILVGLSFGGMLAMEMCKLVQPKKVILISSIRTKNNIPFLFRLAGSVHIQKVLPYKLFTKPNLFYHWLFGPLNKNDQQILNAIIKDIDPVFVAWAIEKVICWQNTAVPQQLFQMHGRKDRLLPFALSGAPYGIKGAGHLAVLSHSTEVNALLAKALQPVD